MELAPCKWEQPRPPIDPLRETPAIGWKAAAVSQRVRRQAAAARTRKPIRQVKDAGIGAFLQARDQLERDAAAARAVDPAEVALLRLRRSGRVAYRMAVLGGEAGLFCVGNSRDLDLDRLLELAERFGR